MQLEQNTGRALPETHVKNGSGAKGGRTGAPPGFEDKVTLNRAEPGDERLLTMSCERRNRE